MINHPSYIVIVDQKVFDSLKDHSDGLFPSIVHLETSKTEDDILKNVSEQVKLIYSDFIVALKLGN